MTARHAVGLSCVLVTTSAPLAGVAGPSAVRAASDTACARRSDAALVRPAVRVMRIVGDPTTTPANWHAADFASLARVARDPDIYSEVASVWRVGDRIAIVSIESRSLEMREETTYCYRANGSLARLQSTSSGMTNIDDEARYFDLRGHVVSTTSKLALLYPRPGATVSPDLRPAKPDVFLRVEALPFYTTLAP